MKLYLLLIAPIYSDPEFELKAKVVRSVCEFAGVGYRLPEPNPGKFDLDAAIETVLGAGVIIADLSHARPSCYYELGLVEGAGRQAVLIARTGTEIFQHSNRAPVEFYSNLEAYESALQRAVNSAQIK